MEWINADFGPTRQSGSPLEFPRAPGL